MNTDLKLPGPVSETALDLPDGLSFEDWMQTGETLGRIGRACQWWIGDWLNYGERKWGEKYEQAVEETGYQASSLMNFAWVSRQIETFRRKENLSFGHHAIVAALDPAEQDTHLSAAAENDWSVSELRQRVRPASASGQSNEGAAHYLPDVVADDALDNLRTQALHWFEQGLLVKGLLDKRRVLEPRSPEDRKAIKREAAQMEKVARRIKEVA